MKLKLTGDDIIRGSYMNGENQGYIQGNFSYSNETLPAWMVSGGRSQHTSPRIQQV
jgi:hypothetical protein